MTINTMLNLYFSAIDSIFIVGWIKSHVSTKTLMPKIQSLKKVEHREEILDAVILKFFFLVSKLSLGMPSSQRSVVVQLATMQSIKEGIPK
jgi:hypothetical protein